MTLILPDALHVSAKHQFIIQSQNTLLPSMATYQDANSPTVINKIAHLHYFERFCRSSSKRPSTESSEEPQAIRRRTSPLSSLPTHSSPSPSKRYSGINENTCTFNASANNQSQTSTLSSPPTERSSPNTGTGAVIKATATPQSLDSELPDKTRSPTGTIREPLPPKSLSSELAPTQTSTIPSSQRVVKDGEIHIRNSDDETGSDASSLEDLDNVLNETERRSPTPELPLSIHPVEAWSAKTGMKDAVGLTKKPSSASSMQKGPRFSLKALAEQKKEFDASKDNIARTRELLQAQERQELRKKTIDTSTFENLLQDYGDSEEVGRLKAAIKRTEALEHDLSWSFFGQDRPSSDYSRLPAIKDHDVGPLLVNDSLRKQSFLSGIVEDYALQDNLPEELLDWMLEETCLEQRDDLRDAYVHVLIQASSQMTDLLSKGRLGSLFRKIGACEAAVRPQAPIEPRIILPKDLEGNQQRPDLIALLSVIRGSALALKTGPRVHAVSLLCRLLLDRSIAEDGLIVASIESTLTALLSALNDRSPFPDPQNKILSNLFHAISHPPFRVQLLRNLPPYSAEWLFLRRRLALAWLFDDENYLDCAECSSTPISRICDLLGTPHFHLNNSTDYALLKSTFQILDIAIDSADRPSPAAITHDIESGFNADIDQLAAKIKGMFMQIVDSGASDMRRTEAKEVLEGLQSRLLYSVRTRPPRKKNIFGGEETYEGERKGMQDFLAAWKARKRRSDSEVPGTEEGVVDTKAISGVSQR